MKKEIGTAWEGSEVREMEIRGRHIADGVPRAQTITSREVHQALSECLSGIVTAIRIALEQTPPELGADIAEKGMVVTGGGALLHDIDKMLGADRSADRDHRRPAHLRRARLRARAGGGGKSGRYLCEISPHGQIRRERLGRAQAPGGRRPGKACDKQP